MSGTSEVMLEPEAGFVVAHRILARAAHDGTHAPLGSATSRRYRREDARLAAATADDAEVGV